MLVFSLHREILIILHDIFNLPWPSQRPEAACISAYWAYILPNSWGQYWTLVPRRFVYCEAGLWHCRLPGVCLFGHMTKYVFVMLHAKLAFRVSSSLIAVVFPVTCSACSFTCDKCMSWIGKRVLLCTQLMIWKNRPLKSLSYTCVGPHCDWSFPTSSSRSASIGNR